MADNIKVPMIQSAFFLICTFIDSPTLPLSLISIPNIKQAVLVLAFTKE